MPGKEFKIKCSSVLLAVGRGSNSFLQKKAGIKTGKKNSIAVDDQYKTSMKGVFAAGDVTTGETFVVKTMASGKEAAQRVHEYLMNINEEYHLFFYEKYYKGKLMTECWKMPTRMGHHLDRHLLIMPVMI